MNTAQLLVEQWTEVSTQDSALAAHVDALVSFAGDWTEAFKLASLVKSAPKTPSSYRLSTYLAAVLSAAGSPEAEIEYRRAVNVSIDDPVDSALARIRLAAWYIRRKKDLDAGLQVLDELTTSTRQQLLNFEITSGDLAVLIGGASNLRAVVCNKQKNPGEP